VLAVLKARHVEIKAPIRVLLTVWNAGALIMRSNGKSRLKYLLLFLLLFLSPPGKGQGHQQRYHALDVQGYHFQIDLSDSTDVIHGHAGIQVLFKEETSQMHLDLSTMDKHGKGMEVLSVSDEDSQVDFIHRNDRLMLRALQVNQGDIKIFHIHYSGVPSDGLIISRNKFGDRTFFGDNWPNRGRHWLPLVDHPSDKAYVEFQIKAPEKYQVVSVGTNLEELRTNGDVVSRWKTAYPLSTKMMVIGVSPFAVEYLESASGIPVSSWVYPQNQKEGFLDYRMAVRPLDFFETYIAPYPFDKLANVQSKTIYGGMENASCIFYHEGSVTGKQQVERLLAHEIAHQWFGDAVSELDWHHIWLSEGFATYLTNVYVEHIHGRKAFVEALRKDRQRVLRFARKHKAPVVDTSLAVSVELLSPNSYQKAAWVLHMLRSEIGDQAFRKCLQTFFHRYKYKNALSRDFQAVAEEITGRDLDLFFRQWLWKAGHPILSARFENQDGKPGIMIRQHQEEEVFAFPLDVDLQDEGECKRLRLDIHARKQFFPLDRSCKNADIALDPETRLLFEPLSKSELQSNRISN
jgi:aminopeptidase N